MESKLIQSINASNFDDLTFESIIPVVVFFSAERCGVCKALSPAIEEIASDFSEKLKILSVDVDENDSLVKRFRLRGIPTLLIFKDGEVKDRITGFQPKAILEAQIQAILKV